MGRPDFPGETPQRTCEVGMENLETIGGRQFKRGAWYMPKSGKGWPKKFFGGNAGITEGAGRPGVHFEDADGTAGVMSHPDWVRWAGEEKPDER
jgi:hypothetical protein